MRPFPSTSPRSLPVLRRHISSHPLHALASFCSPQWPPVLPQQARGGAPDTLYFSRRSTYEHHETTPG